MIISSWNVNGLRAAARKGALTEWIGKQNADVLCMQETKSSEAQVAFLEKDYPSYMKAYRVAEQAGYSGVATWTRGIESVSSPITDDPEGRVLRTDFDEWTLLNIYFPNGGKSPAAWEYKLIFYDRILTLMNELRASGRRVIMVGDLNVAHREIDIARPKENDGKIGFHPKERAWVDRVLDAGWVDVYRSLHPDSVVYSYWHQISRARERNVGWRIDAFYLDEKDVSKVVRIEYDTAQMGSDHCPVTMELV